MRKLRLEPPACRDSLGQEWCSPEALAEANAEIERLKAELFRMKSSLETIARIATVNATQPIEA
jgi:hypothetical protein